MTNFFRILRNIDATPAAGAPAAPAGAPAAPAIPPATPAAPAAAAYSLQNPPKTKEQWDQLAENDPKTWIALTKPRMDQAVREKNELKEKNQQLDARYKNLETQFQSTKKTPAPGELPPAAPGDPNQPFSRENLPTTQEDWDQLFIESPSLAFDLRHFKNEQDRTVADQNQRMQTEFVTERRKHVQTMAERHPDMYVAELDASTGAPKLDDKGKIILKINPATGMPIPNLESDKFKLFDDVYREDPFGYDASKIGPRSAMLEMERRLKERGEKQIEAGQAAGSGQPQTPPDQRGTLPGGVTPPVSSVKASFATDEEKQHAQKAVERGVYKSLEEYCQLRDGKNPGIMEEGRMPQFNK